ncbi:MAG: DUF2344 domain-containing protein [Thermoguttaceae bacterium]|nr:DUF2344 domain-containing protein [Thermoguttaceae bacterium]MBR4751056.1 TIGR03936 family radical SAM-associated protein [Thermoguttaceae bacterium]MBR5760201.1 TIGR03936 family radical SAM-associated protein [Thermoguttaceae bacterium]
MARRRYRLRFSKRGNLRFIGHRDLLRAMERIMRRAELPLAKSQGFHPKPRVSYLSALPLGFSSDDEAMELILEEDWPSEVLLQKLNDSSVEGLDFLRAVPLEEGAPKQQAHAFSYDMTVPEELAEGLDRKIADFMSAQTVEVVKANGKPVDARAPVKELALDGSTLRLVLSAQSGPEAGAREILACLGLDEALFRTIFPNRNRTYIVDELN